MEPIESGHSPHGWPIFRLLDDRALLDALVGTGMRWAEHVRPLVADHYVFAEAPQALMALARSEHVGKIVVGV